MGWTDANRAFAVKTFSKDLGIATLRTFRAHFIFHRNDAVLDCIFNKEQN